MGVLLPDIEPGSGGHRKILSICDYITKKGGNVEIAFISEKSDSELKNIVNDYYYKNCGNIRNYKNNHIKCKKALATHYSTCYEVINWKNVGERIYFIQDFEPLFYPMSTQYVKAYYSYKLDFRHICLGQWVKQYLYDEFGCEAQYVNFPINHSVYNLIDFTSNNKDKEYQQKILFYARPSQPRRLFDFGIETLLRLKAINSNIKISLYGEEIKFKIPKEFKSYGRLTNQNKIAQLYREHTLGLSFSSTNPSLIPFEMLACGLPVFDIDTGKKNLDLVQCTSYISCDLSEEKLARKINEYIYNRELLNDLQKEALSWSANIPSENQFCTEVYELIYN